MAKLLDIQVDALHRWADEVITVTGIPSYIYPERDDRRAIKPYGVAFYSGKFTVHYENRWGRQDTITWNISRFDRNTNPDMLSDTYLPLFKYCWDHLNNSK